MKDTKLLAFLQTIDKYLRCEGDTLKLIFILIAFWIGVNAVLLQVPSKVLDWIRFVYELIAYFFVGIALLQLVHLRGHSPPWLADRLSPFGPRWFGLWILCICFVMTMRWIVQKKREDHSAGLWPLIAPGSVALIGTGLALAIAGVSEAKVAVPDADKLLQPALWPFVIGAVAFLFFWRLAAILFDLTFIWHRYIRLNVMMDRLQEYWDPRNCTS